LSVFAGRELSSKSQQSAVRGERAKKNNSIVFDNNN
jgi:hypothetical protein